MLLAYSWVLQLFIISLTATLFFLKYSTRKFDYWKKRGVFNPKPIPLLGNLSDILFFSQNLVGWITSLYASTNAPFLGIFAFDEPCLILRCPKLIQYVLIKDSSCFVNRSVALPSHDEVMANFTFFQRSPGWKESRRKLTPVFSSGKNKRMFSLVSDVGRDLGQYLQKSLGHIEAKEICAKYATNVIAKCAFGIDAFCFDDEEGVFFKYSRSMFEVSLRNAFATMAYFFRQQLVGIFRVDFINRESVRFFTKVFSETMEKRKTSATRAGDFVDLLNDLKESDKSSESENKMVYGHAIMFFAAGFETTSSAISFTLHELCLNKHIQNKLRKEILETIEEHGGVTYESIQEMKYLRMCIDETLRKYPVIAFLDRVCDVDYKLPGTDLVIEKGMSVFIPMPALHMDEEYFSDPQKYIPERFSKRSCNESGIAYMPFGKGPRNCLGERFGIMSTQLALVHIISRFEVEKCAETPNPVEFSALSFSNQSKVGLPMRLKLYETSTFSQDSIITDGVD